MYTGKIPFPNPDGTVKQIDNQVFDLTVKWLESVAPRKNPDRMRHVLVDQDGRRFGVMPQEFAAIEQALPTIRQEFVTARFSFARRGLAFGLKLETGRPSVSRPVQPEPAPKPSMSADLKDQIGKQAGQPAPAPVIKRRKTLFALCVDASGSMSSIPTACTVAAVNSVLDSIRQSAAQHDQDVEVMMTLFGTGPGYIKQVFGLTPVDRVQHLRADQYRPDGQTPLFECIGRSITVLRCHPAASNPDVSFFVHAITDGEENQSSAPYRPDQVNDMIAQAQATDRWTFAIQVPKGREAGFAARWNVPAGNVQGWEISRAGFEQASVLTSAAIGSYVKMRSSGLRSSKSVYTTDMSAVKLEDLRAKLADVSDQVKTWKVEREVDIKTFAEYRTGQPYVLGSIWYCLTKRETIQSYKGIMIRVKGTRQFYTGPETRRLIGIDPNDKQDATIVPGNHASYDIYVMSTSRNRRLVRGTDVVFLPPTSPVQETWDSEAAQKAADARKAIPVL
jgi:hypothetical protein